MSNLELKSVDATKKLVIFLHGLGSDGQDMIRLAEYFQPHMPDTHFFAPNGIEPYDQANFGYQWFSLRDRSDDNIKTGLSNAIPTIRALIISKLDSLNLALKDLVLVGFSQGAMVAMHLSLVLPQPLNSVVAFSGRVFLPEKIINFRTPVSIIHGEQDQVVPFICMQEAKDLLSKHKVSLETHAIPHLAHTIDMRGINLATKFILKNSVQ